MDNALKKQQAELTKNEPINLSDISAEVIVAPVEKDSDPLNSIYVFSYTIKITNNTSKNFQLINRHWQVFSDGKQIADVKGDGVVGHQPRFRQGDSFQYTSFTVIRDPIGNMQGSFTFITDEGMFFDYHLESFKLSFLDRLSLH